MMGINAEPLTRAMALGTAKALQNMLARIIRHDREDRHVEQTQGPIDIDAMIKEADG
jgi:hypothetical protein